MSERERIDEEICGHPIYAGENRCSTCGRRLTTIEAHRNAGAALRRLGRDIARAYREDVVRLGRRFGRRL